MVDPPSSNRMFGQPSETIAFALPSVASHTLIFVICLVLPNKSLCWHRRYATPLPFGLPMIAWACSDSIKSSLDGSKVFAEHSISHSYL